MSSACSAGCGSRKLSAASSDVNRSPPRTSTAASRLTPRGVSGDAPPPPPPPTLPAALAGALCRRASTAPAPLTCHPLRLLGPPRKKRSAMMVGRCAGKAPEGAQGRSSPAARPRERETLGVMGAAHWRRARA